MQGVTGLNQKKVRGKKETREKGEAQMRKVIQVFLFGIVIFGMARFGFAATTQVDSLLQLLEEKGYVTKEEAAKIKDQIVYDEKEIRATNMKSDIPQWVQDLKLKGDFRLRHEYSKRNDSTDRDRSRGRLRYRLGLETKINDKVNVGVGLASNGASNNSSSSNNARSTNRTFEDAFDKSPIVLDYAFASYTPYEWLNLTGGKIKNPVWEPGDLLWDTDITPEGGAVNLTHKLNDSLSLFSTLDAFILDESSSDQSDPFMYAAQVGFKGKAGEKVDYKIAGTHFQFDNGTKSLLDNRSSPATNTVTAGRYDYTYNTNTVFAEAGLNDPFGEGLPLYIPRIGVFGEYANNPDPDKQNTGWLVGGYMGNPSVGGKGQWKITGSYRSLGKDAWLDSLPDSDFYGGATDVKGYETMMEYGIAKNVVLALDYYRSERIKTTKAPETVFQTDINFKF